MVPEVHHEQPQQLDQDHHEQGLAENRLEVDDRLLGGAGSMRQTLLVTV
jgi:hypothetical protein